MPNIWFRWIHRDNWIFNRKNTSKVNSAGILRKKYITYARIYQNIAKHILNKRSLLATVKSNIFKSFSSLSFPRRCWYKTYEIIIFRFVVLISWSDGFALSLEIFVYSTCFICVMLEILVLIANFIRDRIIAEVWKFPFSDNDKNDFCVSHT